jgi:hypothetical protein
VTLTHRAPRQIIAGDSIEFLVQIPDDVVGWTGSARLTGPCIALDATSCVTEGGDLHVFFAGPVDDRGTKMLPAGQFQLTVWASNGAGQEARRRTIAQFPLSIVANLAEGEPEQNHAATMLRLIERAIKSRVTGNNDGGLEGYTIDGVAATKVPLETLERLRNKYSAEVAQQQNPNGGIGRVKFAFTPTGGIPDMRRRFG